MAETLFLKSKVTADITHYDFPILRKVLQMDKEDVIAEVKTSGLKGRGGAGFPTGLKWELALKEPGDEKYIICNADEGEPGTFKDRFLLENTPLQVLEGIIIAGYAIGAKKGYIYIRGEYAKAINIFMDAIHLAKEENILGEKILGSNFNFDIQLVKGGGAYVCGDETSLINSIEGKRGISRMTPPYPIQKGLFDKPSVVNNVETLTAAAEILSKGGNKYASMGTEKSKGTKLVCLSGDVKEPGVYEVEFGKMTLREIIDEFGKGVNGKLKFIIPGGVSTAILAEEQLDIPYTYEDIAENGSGLGSGAIIVVSEGHELLDLLINVSIFFMDETCGTCFPCREGNKQVYHMLKDAAKKGGFTAEEIQLIKDLGKNMYLVARCGLGQTSLCFICSILEKYEEELLVRG
ncbi:MAG: SLBB domain-containing protein [Halanaerobiales bacterium]|nr:SLBB domain-containing protein [Halanaerobiales bacterium]